MRASLVSKDISYNCLIIVSFITKYSNLLLCTLFLENVLLRRATGAQNIVITEFCNTRDSEAPQPCFASMRFETLMK